jgi:ATP phosphoribosyltransferase
MSEARARGADGRLVFAIPSKGRLMEQAETALAAAGIEIARTTNSRGYQGEIAGLASVEVRFMSSIEIAQQLKSGQVHLGITGEDLLREAVADADVRLEFHRRLGYGRADVVVAVPAFWLDVTRMSDLRALGAEFRRRRRRALRVATKYMNLTRRAFAGHGITDYRIVESLGATEGTPAAGSADLVVDITTTGATLRANGLRVLDDGILLRSEACLVAAKAADWTLSAREGLNELLGRLGA